MVQSNEEAVETFAILPIGKFMSMEKRLKQTEVADEEQPSPKVSDPSEVEEVVEEVPAPPPPPRASVKKKDVKVKYRSTQIKKLLQHIEKKDGAQKISSLENLDDLIKCALGNSKKTLPNEKEFFNFLFENNLAHFVKNRSKISQYYDKATNWFEV